MAVVKSVEWFRALRPAGEHVGRRQCRRAERARSYAKMDARLQAECQEQQGEDHEGSSRRRTEYQSRDFHDYIRSSVLQT